MYDVISNEITDPDQSEAYVDIAIYDNTGKDLTGNYEPYYSQDYTTLIIYKKTINVYTASETKVYDGEALSNDDCWYHESDIVGNMEYPDLSVDTAPEIIDVGSASNMIKFDEDDYYTYNVIPGTLTITPKTLLIRTSSKTKVYDGEELVGDYTIIEGDDVDNIEVEISASITNVGSIQNSIDSITVNDEVDGLKNYNIVYDIGTLTITPKTLTITTPSETKEYDGNPLSNTDCVIEGEISGEDVEVEITCSITNVGSITNTISSISIDGSVEGLSNYNVIINCGTLTVEAKTIEIYFDETTGDVNHSGLASGEDIIVDVNLKNINGVDVYVISNIVFVNALPQNYIVEINYI